MAWAKGKTPAGVGKFKYEKKVRVEGSIPSLDPPHPSLHSTKLNRLHLIRQLS
ncbi:hypothetical protein [Macrococcoides caseolyticum]|uniref:hypothetical protein n=1 Tax=Macrococcoides caseolyticum TaxID=69966 RepID=UPI0012FEFF14|nr:hypothetical protein [Macrococcus caseolyticus]